MSNIRRTTNFSIVIPWKSGNELREKALLNTLNSLYNQETREELEVTNYEVLIVEQIAEHSSNIDYSKCYNNLTHIKLEHNSKFNKSWCMNVGARKAIYDNLIFLDAEMLFGNDYLIRIKNFVLGRLYENNFTPKQLALCWNLHITLIGKDNPICRYNRPDMLRMLGGIWYCNKDFFFNRFGGMNESYIGYGGEDNEAYYRAKYILQDIPELDYPIIHQYHDWEKPSESATNLLNYHLTMIPEIINTLKQTNTGDIRGPKLTG